MIPVKYKDKRRDDETKWFSSLISPFAFKCIYSDGCSLDMSVWMCVFIYRSVPLGGLTCKITSSILLGQKSPSVILSSFCLVFILLPRWVSFCLCLLCVLSFSFFIFIINPLVWVWDVTAFPSLQCPHPSSSFLHLIPFYISVCMCLCVHVCASVWQKRARACRPMPLSLCLTLPPLLQGTITKPHPFSSSFMSSYVSFFFLLGFIHQAITNQINGHFIK